MVLFELSRLRAAHDAALPLACLVKLAAVCLQRSARAASAAVPALDPATTSAAAASAATSGAAAAGVPHLHAGREPLLRDGGAAGRAGGACGGVHGGDLCGGGG